MIEQRSLAIQTLVQTVGVRAEPNFLYYDPDEYDPAVDNLFSWRGYSNGTTEVDGQLQAVELIEDSTDMNQAAVGTLTRSYLVRDSCAFGNAILPDGFSLWYDDASATENRGVLGDAMHPPLDDSAWETQLLGFKDAPILPQQSYEYWANCRGTNFGAALREANNVLLDPLTVRQDGTVWIVVLLSDGAAGATDTVNRDATFEDPDATGADKVTVREANPYNRIDTDGNMVIEYTDEPDPISAVYGTYGFCPYGADPTAPEENIDDGAYDVNGNITEAIGPIGYAARANPPFCADSDPNTRHACNTDLDGDKWRKNNITEIIGVEDQVINNDECAYVYDADDYARDWADFVALRRPNDPNQQLPTIYTIGFNLDYPRDPDPGQTICEANVTSCLGEELMRYIADVGDNNEINRGDYPNASEDRFVGLNYGNYWNAPDQEELEEVFDEIASRLFVRLTG